MINFILSILVGVSLLFNSSTPMAASSEQILTEEGTLSIIMEEDEVANGEFFTEQEIYLEDGSVETILLYNAFNPKTRALEHDGGGNVKYCMAMVASGHTSSGATIYKCVWWTYK